MKIFVDANIVVSVINKEYPLFTYTSRILSLADSPYFRVFTSPVCLAIAFYFAEKKFKAKAAKEKLLVLCKHLHITETNEKCVEQALQNNLVTDFEDGLEYYSALKSDCTCIVTENLKDFYFSEIEVIKSQDFFLKYMSKKK